MAKLELDWVTFDKLCALPNVITTEEIAWIVGISRDTIERRLKEKYGDDMTFAEYRRQKAGKLRATLLAKQWDVAMGGNVSMLIWLGKNYLGQKDRSEVDNILRKSDDDKKLDSLSDKEVDEIYKKELSKKTGGKNK